MPVARSPSNRTVVHRRTRGACVSERVPASRRPWRGSGAMTRPRRRAAARARSQRAAADVAELRRENLRKPDLREPSGDRAQTLGAARGCAVAHATAPPTPRPGPWPRRVPEAAPVRWAIQAFGAAVLPGLELGELVRAESVPISESHSCPLRPPAKRLLQARAAGFQQAGAARADDPLRRRRRHRDLEELVGARRPYLIGARGLDVDLHAAERVQLCDRVVDGHAGIAPRRARPGAVVRAGSMTIGSSTSRS